MGVLILNCVSGVRGHQVDSSEEVTTAPKAASQFGRGRTDKHKLSDVAAPHSIETVFARAAGQALGSPIMPTGKQLTRVVIDNGGGTCKVGFAGQAAPVKLMPNGLAKSRTEHKVFVGDMLDKCQDFSALQ